MLSAELRADLADHNHSGEYMLAVEIICASVSPLSILLDPHKGDLHLGRQKLLETAEMTSACANQGGCYYYSLQKSTVSYEFLVPQPLSHQRYNSMSRWFSADLKTMYP